MSKKWARPTAKAKRTIARYPAKCPKCTDPIEPGMAVRMWGGSWAHCFCEEPWREGRGPKATRSAAHPQHPRPKPLTHC